MKLFYDLHNHSCLSPCADNDNTPHNLLGMATISGLNVLALTDHNSCKNCPAFFEAAKAYDIIPVAGMELTTSEDIHVVFLFRDLESAMSFDKLVEEKRFHIINKPEIFGEQLILDSDDNIVGNIDELLSVATSISVEDVTALAEEYDAICFPAHIDRESNSIVAILGTIPEHLNFKVVELANSASLTKCECHIPANARVLVDSDTHSLSMMRDAEFFIEVLSDSQDKDELRRLFLDSLR